MKKGTGLQRNRADRFVAAVPYMLPRGLAGPAELVGSAGSVNSSQNFNAEVDHRPLFTGHREASLPHLDELETLFKFDRDQEFREEVPLMGLPRMVPQFHRAPILVTTVGTVCDCFVELL